ncbi:MAG TPA: hypothetical protein VGC34_18060 [Steroidobacteraceae bacterium]
MQRENEEEIVGEFAALAAASMRSEAFDSLVQLNGQCLDLLADQALAQVAQGNLLLRQIGEIWRTLDPAARRRAASCPYLLVDAGFSDPGRWRWLEGRHVSDGAPGTYGSFFTVPRASAVARQVFMYAWHLAQSKNSAAQLLLGMPSYCSHVISSCTLPQIHELAERHPEWMRPRWPGKVKVWRELLLAAASGEVVALENARMHGLQLLAGEVRAATLRVT